MQIVMVRLNLLQDQRKFDMNSSNGVPFCGAHLFCSFQDAVQNVTFGDEIWRNFRC